MNKWKTAYNAHEFEKQYEINTMPSETIPDQTLSVKEIMDRFVRGLPVQGAKVPIYEGDESDLPDLSRMDLTERHETIERIKNEVETLKEKVKKPRVRTEEKSETESL